MLYRARWKGRRSHQPLHGFALEGVLAAWKGHDQAILNASASASSCARSGTANVTIEECKAE
jgi:hypothetical protein